MNHKPHQGPPPGPWQKGQHAEYGLAVAEVIVIRDKSGRVFSKHQLQDDGDVGVVQDWPSCGIEQMAFALLTEATRREALLQMLLLESNSPQQFALLQEMTPEARQAKFEAFQQLASSSHVDQPVNIRAVGGQIHAAIGPQGDHD